MGPRKRSLVRKAESVLDLTFPTGYCQFLLEFGAGHFRSREISGLINDNFEESSAIDAIWYTLNERKTGLLPQFVIVATQGDGWLYCLDCSNDEKLRNRVVGYYSPAPSEIQTYEVLWPSFEDMFYELIRETLNR